MAIRDIFKISRKTFVNPSAWIDYSFLKFQNQTIWSVLKFLFTTQKPEYEETFAEAMRRLNLTEEDVRFGATNYRVFAAGFMILGILALFHSFYLLFYHGVFFACLLGFAASALFFAQAFKYDFWSLQMRRRKLGITFEEWKQTIFGTKKDDTK